jgi:hypothetical protein
MGVKKQYNNGLPRKSRPPKPKVGTPEERLEKERARGRAKYYKKRANNLAKGEEYCKELRDKQNEKTKKRYDDSPEVRARLAERSKTYHDENKDKISKQKKEKYQANKEELAKKRAQDKIDHPEKAERRRLLKRLNRQKRVENDPCFRFRENVSAFIRQILKRSGSSKMGQSIKQSLPAPIEVMVAHINMLFAHPDNLTPDGEIWMSWDNWAPFDPKTWIDDDYSTHTWHLDHIIPQSKLPYTSMEDDNFKKCWALENLRPYSAKLNLSEGDRS